MIDLVKTIMCSSINEDSIRNGEQLSNKRDGYNILIDDECPDTEIWIYDDIGLKYCVGVI